MMCGLRGLSVSGTNVFQDQVSAEQGVDGAGLEEPEYEAGEAVVDSDAGEELLVEDDAMNWRKQQLADADEGAQIVAIAPVEVDNVLGAPLALASRGPSAAAMEIDIRAGIEKARRCRFLAAICGRHREGPAQALRHRRTNGRVLPASAQF